MKRIIMLLVVALATAGSLTATASASKVVKTTTFYLNCGAVSVPTDSDVADILSEAIDENGGVINTDGSDVPEEGSATDGDTAFTDPTLDAIDEGEWPFDTEGFDSPFTVHVSLSPCPVPPQTAGGFLSYGTPDVIPFADEATGDAMLKAGYTQPYCSKTPNPYNNATYGKWHLWGVIPADEHNTNVLGDASGTSTFSGGVAAVLVLHSGFCWITA